MNLKTTVTNKVLSFISAKIWEPIIYKKWLLQNFDYVFSTFKTVMIIQKTAKNATKTLIPLSNKLKFNGDYLTNE